MERTEFNTIIKLHKLWLAHSYEGRRARFDGEYLRGMNFEGMDLTGADFEGANLKEANFRNAILNGVRFRGARLEGADLRGTNLDGANLEGANLRCADFEGANLGKSNFKGADLYGADLRWVDLRRVDLRDTALIVMQLPKRTAYIYDDAMRINGPHRSYQEWMNFSDAEIEEMFPNDLDWWKKYKPVLKAAMESIKTVKNS
jgi:uncharacterized protein YjbI with pentapeptide repeats